MDRVRPDRGRTRPARRPGRQGIGCLGTLAVGVAGAFLGGFLGEAVLDRDVDLGFDLASLAFAVVGAILLLLALQALGRRGRR